MSAPPKPLNFRAATFVVRGGMRDAVKNMEKLSGDGSATEVRIARSIVDLLNHLADLLKTGCDEAER